MAAGLELFKRHVRGILVQHCVKCHGGESTESDFNLADRPGLLKGGSLGAAIVPGDSRASLLYKLVVRSQEPYMPHEGSKLPDADLARLAAWIDAGAPYDGPLVGTDVAAVPWTEKTVPASAREFWSFRPLKPVTPPKVEDPWCRTPVDRFILAAQATAGLRPNQEADRRTLIRRAYFDLLGLPPSPEQVAAFVADPAPDAYERLVDRLLADEHVGERWARHWLDVARFAESHGYEQDYDRPHAYTYRDFVIRAFNDDLPYDKFVRWQIAGDELDPDNPQALMATGFLAAGTHATQITANTAEKERYDELDDMARTLGTAMLGLTVGCARCHDHKFDPIPSRDYYQLVSTFTTTVRSDIDVVLDPESNRRAKVAFDQAHAPLAATLARYERDELPGKFAAWLAQPASARTSAEAPWLALDIAAPRSTGSATFRKLVDDSLLVSGANPDTDTFTLTATTSLTEIRHVRLEALAHESLVKGGPGRADNGNFALTDVRLTAAPQKGDGKPVTVKLLRPRASFEQARLPATATIDDDQKSGWAVDPRFGEDHAVAYELESPIGFAGGTRLTLTLDFRNNKRHAIGRPRFSISSAAEPPALFAETLPQSVQATLAMLDRQGADKLKPEDRAKLLAFFRAQDAGWRAVHEPVFAHLKQAPRAHTQRALISSEGTPAVRLHTQGPDFYQQTYFLKRGDLAQKEGEAPAGFLQVVTRSVDEHRWKTASPPAGSKLSYRRRALAEWITDTESGAGHLLARVMVNRLWQHHLGRGIVGTPSDFGTQGERPTHPELLDYLARELVDHGWSLKHVHRLIMTSAVYRQSTAHDAARARLDPTNRLLWRRWPLRLEAEVIRDAMLAVSGQWDHTMFGPGTLDPNQRRRSIYFFVKRSKLVPMMVLFDAPDTLGGMDRRPTTTVAPQSLLVMNSTAVRGYAEALASRVAPSTDTPPAEAVRRAYQLALARDPTSDEQAEADRFLRDQAAAYRGEQKPRPEHTALADYCQVLLGLNEFVYID